MKKPIVEKDSPRLPGFNSLDTAADSILQCSVRVVTGKRIKLSTIDVAPQKAIWSYYRQARDALGFAITRICQLTVHQSY